MSSNAASTAPKDVSGAAPSKYGHDPREGPRKEVTPVLPREGWSPVSAGQIGTIASVSEFNLALEAAGERLVAIKFQREGCAACKSTAGFFQAAAYDYTGAADFYLIDYDQAKPLCRSSELKIVPCAHLYREGTLRAALGLGRKAWDDFAGRLAEEVQR
eukprot:CAMPEP_0183340610 /NCGR_PEP_ID=MMETSP0164_2-20130417/7105_1 /TAXON_ID=221442 /ORGANISM="Coccolithus pelagicus ssp braarudi, Strain PLY182g" /LENGTH=158 /DNA_ID=CAMNT_0025510779 /DNA_START=53 /DNA_END=529 /DNA_ORIENTATION=+